MGCDRPRKRKKTISPEFRSNSTRARKFQKKIAKKIQRNKKHYSGVISIQTRMRQAEKEKKKILVPNSVPTRAEQENSKKNSKRILKINKTSFRHCFYPNLYEIGQEREKTF